jgi:hypothetical protein
MNIILYKERQTQTNLYNKQVIQYKICELTEGKQFIIFILFRIIPYLAWNTAARALKQPSDTSLVPV